MVNAGKLVDSGRGYKTFQPNSLQEIEGELDISSLFTEITDATLALGELKAINSLLPNPDLLIEKYALREAVLSSQIEGTQSTMVEVLRNETDGFCRKCQVADVGIPYGRATQVFEPARDTHADITCGRADRKHGYLYRLAIATESTGDRQRALESLERRQ